MKISPLIALFLTCSVLAACGFSEDDSNVGSEDDFNNAFCADVKGSREVRHKYTYPGGRSYVVVDCETADMVYEGGLDRRSSLDSLQQALFAAAITGKRPGVVIYDTDGIVGKYEHRIKNACESVGVVFRRWPAQAVKVTR